MATYLLIVLPYDNDTVIFSMVRIESLVFLHSNQVLLFIIDGLEKFISAS